MHSPASIGQAIADLIMSHTTDHGELPDGFEDLQTTKHDTGLLVWEFDDGEGNKQIFRAIITQTWGETAEKSALGRAVDDQRSSGSGS